MANTVNRSSDNAAQGKIAVPVEEGSPWSARHLPEVGISRSLRFSVVAIAAGLVAVVLAIAVVGPISTGGAQMEPARFQAPARERQDVIRRATVLAPAGGGFTVAAAHR